jgi:hypothetical protein
MEGFSQTLSVGFKGEIANEEGIACVADSVTEVLATILLPLIIAGPGIREVNIQSSTIQLIARSLTVGISSIVRVLEVNVAVTAILLACQIKEHRNHLTLWSDHFHGQ